MSLAADGALAFGVERQPDFSQVGRRSLTAWIRPGSYADLATWFRTNLGHFNSEIGMTTRSALVTRKQLNVLEEAWSVQAMFDEGYTADGAAQALRWSRTKVTARAKIVTLPVPSDDTSGDKCHEDRKGYGRPFGLSASYTVRKRPAMSRTQATYSSGV